MSRYQNYFPASRWLKRYQRRHLYADFMAGINLAATMLPKSMAYAVVAGMTPIYGLYACCIAPAIAVLFGSNQLLFTGPAGVITVLVAIAVKPLAVPGSLHYLQLVALLSLLVGIMLLTVGVLRFGFLLKLISSAAVEGFISAAAVIICIGQLQDVMAIKIPFERYTIVSVFQLIKHAPEIQWVTFSLSVVAFGLIGLGNRYAPKFPSMIVVLLVMTLLTAGFHLDQHGIAVIGAMSYSMPSLTIPSISFHQIEMLFGSAIVISIVAMAEVYSISESITKSKRKRVNYDQEFIGQGLANLLTACLGSYVVSASFSGSSVNKSSGAKTGLSIVIFSCIAFFATIFLAPLFHYIPRLMLAVIVILAVYQMFSPRHLWHLYKINKPDGLVAFVTFALCILTQPEWGVVAGAVLALALFVWKTMQAGIQVVVQDAKTGFYKTAKTLPEEELIPILRLEGPLVYVNADQLEDKVLSLLKSREDVSDVILDMGSVYYLDTAGIEAIQFMAKKLRRKGVRLHLANLQKKSMRQALKQAGVKKKHIGIFKTLPKALAAIEEEFDDSED